MAKIKFDIEIMKVAVIPTNQGPARIGVVEYEETKDGIKSVLIEVDPTVPPELLEQLKQHPEVIALADQCSAPKNFIVLNGIIH